MDEDAVRREVEREAQAITERMREVVDGLETLQTTYWERFHRVSVQTWTHDDLLWLDNHGFDYRSVIRKEASDA